MNRLPIRVKVTLAFALVMAVVLLSAGLYLYFSLASNVDTTINQGLYSRASDVSALAREADGGLNLSGRSKLAKEGENFAQVVSLNGTVVDSTPGFASQKLLSTSEINSAAQRSEFIDHVDSGENDPVRLLATPVKAHGQQLIVVVGTSLEDRFGTLNALRRLLLIGGLISLLVASGAGYVVAAAALRPVERMRQRAVTISADDPGVRLPLPPADDEVRRLGESLNQMLGRLESAVAHEREFVSDASHELRTPLAVLRTELELALRQSRSESEMKLALASALEETVRLVELSEDLLVLARMDGSPDSERSASTSIGDCAVELFEGYLPRFASVDRDLVCESPRDLRVDVDPVETRRALSNLLENSLMHGAGKTILEVTDLGASALITVEDHGAGFPPDFLPNAFERFSRPNESRHLPGGGLGLAIVDAVARSNGGTATAMNLAGGGARVELRLPVHGDQPRRRDQPR